MATSLEEQLLNIKKKAMGIGMSAGLIASLLATAMAPSALAAITIGSAGNVPVGGTSATAATFTFTEQAIASIPTNTAGSFTVTIAPAAPGAGSVSFVGTPSTAGSTGSLGATASIAGPVLTVNIAGSDVVNIESIIVTGLKISAAAGTSLGAITATLSAGTGSLAGAAAIFSGGGTATGTLAVGHGIGAASYLVNLTSPGCAFSNTGGTAGLYAFATSPESLAGTASAVVAGQQTLTITTVGGAANVHNANEVVSQTTGCAASSTLASPGTVVAALTYATLANPSVFPGENNSVAGGLTLLEPSIGFLPAASTFTFTITTPGVVFSTAPTITDNNAAMVLTAPVISVNRLTATVTVTTASTIAPALITLSGILYDVAASVPAGTFISVGRRDEWGAGRPAADEHQRRRLPRDHRHGAEPDGLHR